MATTSNQVEVQGVAVLVVPAAGPAQTRSGRFGGGPSRFVTVKNLGAAIAFVGGTDVADNTGVPINAGGAFGFWLNSDDELWAVTAGELATVSYVETGGSPLR